MLFRCAGAFPLILVCLTVAMPHAQESVSVGQQFEETLARDGLEAALDELNRALADSSKHDSIDPYELGIGLPSRLVVRHQRAEALALIQALEPYFSDHPRYQQELGLAYLRCGHVEEARAALTRASEVGNRPDLAWMVERIDELAALELQKAELEDHLVPGEPTGLEGPWFGQSPPGVVPEVFAPGYINTTAHEYHISFAPDGREIVFSRSGVGTLATRWTPEGWTVPEVVHLIDENHLTEESNLTPDGEAIIFCGRADIHESRMLYRAKREGRGWGSPELLFPGRSLVRLRHHSGCGGAQAQGQDGGRGRDHGLRPDHA